MKYILIYISLFLVACAQINDLTGGSDDEYAPTLDSAKTFPYNGQTNFSGDKIQLKFNEYVTLVKPNDNILITPRPVIPPTITSHNKTVTIQFNEPLLDNTTYTLNFNKAIADITEKNDSIFQFVFSTGNYIDSLSLAGNVKDAFLNTGSDGYLIALYPVSNELQFDSVPYLSKPMYIAESDKNGFFQLNYLKYGLYYLFAFDDKNKNLLLDSDEHVAFLPEKSILINDKNLSVELKAFAQTTSVSEIEKVKFSAPGKVEIILSNPADTFSISTTLTLHEEETFSDDSLVYWLASNPTPRMRFVTVLNGVTDTLKPVYKLADNDTRLTYNTNIKDGKLLPNEPLKITFSEPITVDQLVGEKIRIMSADSTILEPVWKVENLRTLVLVNSPVTSSILQIDSGAVTSIYGTSNLSRVNINFENHPTTYYGSLIVNLDSTFTEPVLIYLLDSKGAAVDTASYSSAIEFKNLLPGDYQLRLVIDSDENGVWTSGSLATGAVPEKVIYFNEIITVKSKWIKEVDWLLGGLKQ